MALPTPSFKEGLQRRQSKVALPTNVQAYFKVFFLSKLQKYHKEQKLPDVEAGDLWMGAKYSYGVRDHFADYVRHLMRKHSLNAFLCYSNSARYTPVITFGAISNKCTFCIRKRFD